MILIDNRNVLRIKDRDLLARMAALEDSEPTGNVIVEQAKTGVPTLKIAIDGKMQYVHSKYDPEKDAQRLIDKFEGKSVKHALFVGVGLGYHIQAFTKAHPDMKFSIYEPNEEVLLAYLSYAKLNQLPLENLSQIFIGIDSEHIKNEMQQLLEKSNGMLEVMVLPIYEKLYGNQVATIINEAVDMLKEKRTILVTNTSFQKRWTVNSVKNFPAVLKSPNMLHDVDRNFFEGKPAIIVAAGPSLNEEFENLRYIKENGLAYIFSVGSAINALIEHGIYPDAACTYDPGVKNQLVIQRIKDDEIHEIPLIFGSSVGFETLENYPGKMFHMLINQDSISPYLLEATKSVDRVLDAPSIAVVTFQLLAKLRCNPVILVGQNLGYQDNKRYASGINYDYMTNELNEMEKRESITIKDVYGHDIQTNNGFNLMRQQLEMHIQANRSIDVINTTRGGAHIEDTSFSHLDDLINEKLTTKVVGNKWMEALNSYDVEYTKRQVNQILQAEESCVNILQHALDELKSINTAVETRQKNNLEKHFVSFDKSFKKLDNNSFYNAFVKSMLKVQYERISAESQAIRYETDLLKKAEVIVELFYNYIQEVYLHVKFVLRYVKEMKERIEL